jgi:hypothetical protein
MFVHIGFYYLGLVKDLYKDSIGPAAEVNCHDDFKQHKMYELHYILSSKTSNLALTAF